MKPNLKLLSMMTAFASISASNKNYYGSDYEKPKDMLDPREKSTIKNMSEEDRHEMNGLKRFQYPKGHVYALNQKNADRKAKKLNLL